MMNATKLESRRRLGHDPVSRWLMSAVRWVRQTLDLLRISVPDQPRLLERITIMEQDIVLPLKVAGVAMLLYSFYAKGKWVNVLKNAFEVSVDSVTTLLWVYIGVTLVVGCLLLARRRVPIGFLQAVIFCDCLMDGILVGALTLLTGGYPSPLYWLFLGLIIRSAVSIPRGSSQIMLNLTLSAYYVIAGAIEVKIGKTLPTDALEESALLSSGRPTESLAMRLVLLLLMTICCYGVQVLLERQRRALEEAREFAMREGQLRAAGRLAAEFTHQIKNPLGIINNAIFSVQRALKQGKPIAEQIQIIQEEVEHSDRIITQIMGYAQLSEGRVEKLDVLEELERAILRVFPPAADFKVAVQRDYHPPLPALVMQRRHLFDTFVNVLQNAREAYEGRPGNIFVSARSDEDYQIQVIIRDEGLGIPPDKLGKVFEAYYTTKAKGTGLGLASVKTNVELYSGTVRVESELGKGASFILTFPAKTLMKIAGQTV